MTRHHAIPRRGNIAAVRGRELPTILITSKIWDSTRSGYHPCPPMSKESLAMERHSMGESRMTFTSNALIETTRSKVLDSGSQFY